MRNLPPSQLPCRGTGAHSGCAPGVHLFTRVVRAYSPGRGSRGKGATVRIAFYAPLKAPDHPVPSGDRLMAGLLMRALGLAGHEVSLASHLRPFLRRADEGSLAAFRAGAEAEATRLRALWAGAPPDLWFSYHPYYKSPDLLGPGLAREWGIPYVTAESSWSARRTAGDWGAAQEAVRDGLALAALNLCMTARDRAGILEGVPGARTARLMPFIEAAPFLSRPLRPEPGHLVTVAMMRPGDKLSSYLALAGALRGLGPGWHLSVAGDGPAAAGVKAAFAGLPVTFLGALAPQGVADLLSRGAVYVWPGHGEAYGLAYLEAQAAGLPVVAEATAGVPEVVRDGVTGLLVAERDTPALTAALRRLLDDAALRTRMALAARAFVRDERDIAPAAATLGRQLSALTGAPDER